MPTANIDFNTTSWRVNKGQGITTTHLLFLEVRAAAESVVVEIVDGRLDAASAGLHRPGEVLLWNPSGAEHVAVGEPLRCDVADGKLRQNNLEKDRQVNCRVLVCMNSGLFRTC